MRQTTPMQLAEQEEDRCLHGNCPYEKEPEGTYCKLHQGNRQTSLTAKKKVTEYELAETEYLQELNRAITSKGHDPQRHSLRKEIGITEVLIQNTLNKAKDSTSLLILKDELINLLTCIERLKKTDLQMSKDTGDLISSDEVMGLARQLLTVVTDNLLPLTKTNPEVQKALERIADDFSAVFN